MSVGISGSGDSDFCLVWRLDKCERDCVKVMSVLLVVHVACSVIGGGPLIEGPGCMVCC